jgi:DNA-binding transcriptional MocR family regulator
MRPIALSERLGRWSARRGPLHVLPASPLRLLIDDEALADLRQPGEGRPPPLAAYGESVISVGALSKVVWGGLRVGWIRAAEPVVAGLARMRAVLDLGGNVPARLTAADLLPRLDELCDRRARQRRAGHDHLRAEPVRRLPDWDAPPVRGGPPLWVRPPYGDGGSFVQVAIWHRVAVLPPGPLDVSGGGEKYVRLRFLSPRDRLSEAVRWLAAAWRDYMPEPESARARTTLAV